MSKIKIFESKQVRTHWDENKKKWFFAIIDVVGILTGSERPRKYWNDLKVKLTQEGYIEVPEKIGQLKMTAKDGNISF
jgi:DNA-damage-inducible protein D